MALDKKKLTKNTIYLYLRMIITTIISLYTSRVILDVLGFVDYGIYNVVGGLVIIIGFLSSTMSASSSRFLAIAIEKGDHENLKDVFKTSNTLHLILAIIIFIIGETVGIWAVNNILNFPEQQTTAVNIVYQLSLLSTCISIVQIPYNALIIAHEDIHKFAIFQIIESVLKLIVAFVLMAISKERLIVYSTLLFGVSLLMRFLYTSYSVKNYSECRFGIKLCKSHVKSIASFSGWDILGHLGFSARQQGSNIILNHFFGATINAATGLATTVQGVVSQFSSNIITAARPQIIKNYSSGNLLVFRQLIVNITTLSLIMILLVTVPLMINIHNVLSLWLVTIPEYCQPFTQCCLIGGIISSISIVFLAGIHAVGNVKFSSIGRNVVYITSLFIVYLMLKYGFSPVSAYIIFILTQLLTLANDVVLLRKIITINYIIFIAKKIIIICSLSLLSGYIASLIDIHWSILLSIFISSIAYVIIFCSSIYIFVLNKEQKEMIRAKLKLNSLLN